MFLVVDSGIIHLVRTQNFPKIYYFLPPDTRNRTSSSPTQETSYFMSIFHK